MARKPRKSREEADPEDAESENEESVQKITKVWAQNLYSDINQHLIEFLIKNKLTQQIEETLKKQRMNIYKISQMENKNKKKSLQKGWDLIVETAKKDEYYKYNTPTATKTTDEKEDNLPGNTLGYVSFVRRVKKCYEPWLICILSMWKLEYFVDKLQTKHRKLSKKALRIK